MTKLADVNRYGTTEAVREHSTERSLRLPVHVVYMKSPQFSQRHVKDNVCIMILRALTDVQVKCYVLP